MKAILLHEWRQTHANAGGLAASLLFVFAVVAVAAFAIGADLPRLAATGPAILWIAVLLAALLGNERLFEADLHDGTLDVLRTGGTRVLLYGAAKLSAKWGFGVLPLVLVSPFAGALLAMPGAAILGTFLTLLAGSFALASLSAFGAALAGRGNAVLGPIVVMPLLVPVVIFGASAASAFGTAGFASPFLFLCAASVAATAVAPVAIAAALEARG